MGSFVGPIRDQIFAQNHVSALYQNVYLYRLVKDFQDRTLISDSYMQSMLRSSVREPDSSYFCIISEEA